MTNNPKAKLKTLYVMRILQDETDAEHGLSLRQIIERLNDYGIQAERKGLYRDIEALREFGFDIQTYQRNPVQYAIASRDFTLSELMLLVDAVESCKFLTKRQSRSLTTNLKLLASDHERALLDRRIHVPGRITSKRDSVFEDIDTLHDAMRLQKKVEFKYFKYGLDGTRFATHDGMKHVVTPVGMCLAIEISTLWPDWSRHFGSGCRPAFIVVPASASRPFACSHLQIPPGDRGARCDRWPRRPVFRLRGSFPTC